ncbi:MAG: 50, gp50 [Streptosporangiaceae bacterium]|nr:50, gp50 [Streptosporangiaceae bacterium]
MKLYIAGPMSGFPDYNYPAFERAEGLLQSKGYQTLNPANNPACDTWDDYMRAAIAQVIQADGIAVLPAWQMSAGAALEVHIAHALRVPVHSVDHWAAHTPAEMIS